MPKPRRTVMAALERKGFASSEGDHTKKISISHLANLIML